MPAQPLYAYNSIVIKLYDPHHSHSGKNCLFTGKTALVLYAYGWAGTYWWIQPR